MPLHIDHRPSKFVAFYGNNRVVEDVKNHLKKRRPNHTILITGPAGCGKTTMARIISKELGVYDPKKSETESMDYTELNAADFRGIDMVRDIRNSYRYNPMISPYRIWFFDECHKLSPDAQEAMLKMMEHTPSHVWFIMATTEPSKLKTTFRRRCTEFVLDLLDEDEMKKLLNRVAKREKIKLKEKVLSLIISLSNGSPGEALNLMDKAILVDEKNIEQSLQRLETTHDTIINLCRLIMKKNWKACSSVLRGDLKKENPETIRRMILAYFGTVLISGRQDAYLVMDCFRQPTYDTGFNGIIMAVYEACSGE